VDVLLRAREQEELVGRMEEIEARLGTSRKPRGA
jgi:BMFP domain-containing protein YqiC